MSWYVLLVCFMFGERGEDKLSHRMQFSIQYVYKICKSVVVLCDFHPVLLVIFVVFLFRSTTTLCCQLLEVVDLLHKTVTFSGLFYKKW